MGYEVIRNPNRVPTFVSKGPTKKKKTSSRATAASTYAASQFAKAIAATKLVVGPHSGDPRGTSSYEGGHPGGWTANSPTSPYSPGPNSYTAPARTFSHAVDTTAGLPAGSLGPMGPQGIGDLFGGSSKAQPQPSGGGDSGGDSGGMSVGDLIAALQPKPIDIGPAPTKAGVAGPAHYTPSLVDIASLVAPYGKARNSSVIEFAANKKQIDRLGKSEQRDVQLQNKLEVANQLRLKADYAQQDAELHAHLSGLAKLGAGDIAGQGFTDPSVTAPIRAAADAETRSGDAQSKAGQRLIAGQSAEAQLDAHRQGVDAQAGTNAAQQQLSGNLSDIANALNLQEASAKAQGERQNAQSRNEAEQMNAKEQQQYMQNVMNANSQFSDASQKYSMAQQGQSGDALKFRQTILDALGQMGGFAQPNQASVLHDLSTYPGHHPDQKRVDNIQAIFSMSPDMGTALKAVSKVANSAADGQWYIDKIKQYYQQDEGMASADAVKKLMAYYGK